LLIEYHDDYQEISGKNNFFRTEMFEILNCCRLGLMNAAGMRSITWPIVDILAACKQYIVKTGCEKTKPLQL
jgi:hypothetical protein